MRLRRVLAISKGLHTVTEITPAVRPEMKSLTLYLCLLFSYCQKVVIFTIKLL